MLCIRIPASTNARAVPAGRYDAAAAARYLESGAEDEAGSEDAFELLHEIGERVRAHCTDCTLPYSYYRVPRAVGTLGTSTSGAPGSTALVRQLCLGTRRAF